MWCCADTDSLHPSRTRSRLKLPQKIMTQPQRKWMHFELGLLNTVTNAIHPENWGHPWSIWRFTSTKLNNCPRIIATINMLWQWGCQALGRNDLKLHWGQNSAWWGQRPLSGTKSCVHSQLLKLHTRNTLHRRSTAYKQKILPQPFWHFFSKHWIHIILYSVEHILQIYIRWLFPTECEKIKAK